MHKLTFYPLGNADCCLIDLDNGQKILFDYAHMRDSSDKNDLRVDLEKTLRDDLESAERDGYDVVAFTHLDDDHIHGASEFFYLEHAKKYQTEGRIKMPMLWVPAAAIIEENCEDEAAIIQTEARYRLREGKGIRIFSRPDKLKDWLEKQGLSLKDRQHLITDAGQPIPGFTLADQGVEFFVHSPFASRLDDGTLVDRNIDALVVQATFIYGRQKTKLILSSDITHEVITAMVNVTKYHKNEARLEWHVIKLPHHCSYLSLAPERGKNKTKPVPEVKWLFEGQGQQGGIIVSTSKPIPTNDEDNQPPHRQAANYYREVAATIGGEFIVTMEHPTKSAPEPLVITIDSFGATVKKRNIGAAGIISSRPAPRAG